MHPQLLWFTARQVRRTNVVVYAAFFSSDRKAIAERGELLSTQRVSSRSLLRERKQQTQRQVEHENPDRRGVLRQETGRIVEDSGPI